MSAMDAVNAVNAVNAAAAGMAAAERGRLLAQGFSAEQAERLMALKRRGARRSEDGLSANRLRFARWLVATRRLNEGLPVRP